MHILFLIIAKQFVVDRLPYVVWIVMLSNFYSLLLLKFNFGAYLDPVEFDLFIPR